MVLPCSFGLLFVCVRDSVLTVVRLLVCVHVLMLHEGCGLVHLCIHSM